MNVAARGGALHLVSLSAVTWRFPLVGRTRMLAEAWHDLGHRSTFVEVPSYRTGLERAFRGARSGGEPGVVRPWPGLPSRVWSESDSAALRRGIARRARELRRRLEPRVDWARSVAVVVSPVWLPWLAELPFRAVVYDCIDALEVHLPRARLAPLYRRWEAELLERAALAVVSATELGETLRARRPDLPIEMVQNGVDADSFRSRAERLPQPADLPRRGRPIVGFVGALYEWFDWELLRAVARRLPELDFVLVGPRPRGPAPVAAENVHLLGARRYSEVPSSVRAFDVCWVPFRQSRVARLANPVKIYEYLALGKPVVTSRVADLPSFDGLVAGATSAEEHAEAIRKALEDPGDAGKRADFARASSWSVRASRYAGILEALA